MDQEVRFCNSADGTRIAYATYGEPAARALVLVESFENAPVFLWKDRRKQTFYDGLASGRRLITLGSRRRPAPATCTCPHCLPCRAR